MSDQTICEWCGPVCHNGACHNARKEAGDRWGTLEGDEMKDEMEGLGLPPLDVRREDVTRSQTRYPPPDCEGAGYHFARHENQARLCRERQLLEAQAALRKVEGERDAANKLLGDRPIVCVWCGWKTVKVESAEHFASVWPTMTHHVCRECPEAPHMRMAAALEAAESELVALRGSGEGGEGTECGHSFYMHPHVADGLGCEHRSENGSPCGCARVTPHDTPYFEGSLSERLLEGDCQERLSQIVDWCNAYPEEMFTPVSHEDIAKAHTILEANGISLSAIHGGWARHLLTGIRKIALSSPKPSPERVPEDGWEVSMSEAEPRVYSSAEAAIWSVHDGMCACGERPEKCQEEGISVACLQAATALLDGGEWGESYEDGWIKVKRIVFSSLHNQGDGGGK